MVILFPTYGRRCPDSGNWLLNVHGWSFNQKEDSRKRRLLLGMLRKFAGLTDADEQSTLFAERARAFIVRHPARAAVTVEILGREFPAGVPDSNGHFHSLIQLGQEVGGLDTNTTDCPSPVLELQAVANESIRGRVHLIAAEGVSVISDIDDTIKITESNSRRATLRRTFCEPFEAVEGMSRVYRTWQDRGACFHYVSASPWQLYRPLSEFIQSVEFPSGSFHLKAFAWSKLISGAFLESPAEHKRLEIERLLNNFPQRQFFLVGDGGQQDAQVYGQLARTYPAQIKCVLIRALEPLEQAKNAVEFHMDGLRPTQWRVFENPQTLQDLI